MNAQAISSTIVNLRARAKKAAEAGNTDRAKELEAEAAIYEKQLKQAEAKPKPKP